MELISFIAIIILSLVGYCAGAVGKASKSVELKPQIIDLSLIVVIWAGAVYSRIALDLDRWLIILIWVILSAVIGMLAIWPRKLAETEASIVDESKGASKNRLANLWQRWTDFSKRAGAFQSRIVLSLFFFILVLPFALAVKVFSDPLGLKYRNNESLWLLRMKTEVGLEQYRRQF